MGKRGGGLPYFSHPIYSHRREINGLTDGGQKGRAPRHFLIKGGKKIIKEKGDVREGKEKRGKPGLFSLL